MTRSQKIYDRVRMAFAAARPKGRITPEIEESVDDMANEYLVQQQRLLRMEQELHDFIKERE